MLWKDVVGYEGLYEVNNYGRIRRDGCLLQQTQTPQGYTKVTLTKGGLQKKFWVHRLVAGAFHPNTHNKRTVNHIDKDRTNNRASNLEWMTDIENIQHSAKLTVDIVRGMLFDFHYGLTNKDMGMLYGVSRQSIGDIRKGRAWSNITGIKENK